jgi:hypothetical protein
LADENDDPYYDPHECIVRQLIMKNISEKHHTVFNCSDISEILNKLDVKNRSIMYRYCMQHVSENLHKVCPHQDIKNLFEWIASKKKISSI